MMTPTFRLVAAAAALLLAAEGARPTDALPERHPPGTEAPALSSFNEMPQADRVVVRKAQRKLHLMHGDTILRSYRVALGLNPVGRKERAGDFRTPEGTYRLTRRNSRSEYFLSIQVSYPSEHDLKRARRNRVDPGGQIMIHGFPNQLRHAPQYYETRDWTDGCIAVSNSDMVEIWLLTPDNVPIEIWP
jgi:murein L,D-transpeptidase YafK